MAKTSGPEATPTPAVATPPIEAPTSAIDKARAVNETIDTRVLNNLGSEKGVLASAFNRLKIKMGWLSDVAGYSKLNTVDKFKMYLGDKNNNEVIQKKKGEISQVEDKIKMNAEQDEKRKASAVENLDSINKTIEEARARGDAAMLAILEKTRDSMKNETSLSNTEALEATKKSLDTSLKSYQERKVIIVDNFVGNIEMKIGNIKQNTNYQENLNKRKDIDCGIEQLSGVINGVDSQVVSLKKALSFARSREDKNKIKESIEEYKKLSKDSKEKLKKLEEVRTRLARFINGTEKRTKKFEDLKYKYLDKRNSTGKEPANESSTGAETGSSSSTTELSTESDSEGGESWYTKEDEELVSKAVKRDEILESIEKLTKTGRRKAEDISKLKVWLGSLVNVFKALKTMSILESGEKDKIKKQEDLLAIISNEIKTTPPPKITPAIYDKIKKFSIDAIAEFKS